LVALVVVFAVTVWYSYTGFDSSSTSVILDYDASWRTPNMVSGPVGRAAL
jgi:hypothetical protein